jgi:hypothetical protein
LIRNSAMDFEYRDIPILTESLAFNELGSRTFTESGLS